jgi:diguanylate cyclase (GGDEF)-like protein
MSSTPRIALVVDDDLAILRLMRAWLASAGYTVMLAEDGNQAKDIIELHQPHLVISDWEMPSCTGLELCKWIRSQTLPHYTYIIIQTVRSGSDSVVNALDAGANDFMQKPVSKAEILARLRAAERVLDLEAELSKLAKTDPLSGLATRRTFQDQLGREWRRAQRHFFPLSCVMIDIDFFKRINDTYGHSAGDEVIKHIADLLQASVRSSDLVCRFGGEEFCVLLPETDEQQAHLWAERVRAKIESTPAVIGKMNLNITASIGVAQRMADTKTPEELIDMSDQALLVAKNSGRNRVLSFTSLGCSTTESSNDFSPEELFRGLPAREAMTPLLAGLQADETVRSAVQFFLRFRVASAPVVDKSGQLVGILSEKDLMAIMLLPQWWLTPIRDVMKSNVVCYEEDTPAIRIYEFLCRVSIRTAVITRNGKPTGLINRGSLLRWFANSQTACQRDIAASATSEPDEAALPGLDAREQLRGTSVALVEETTRLRAELERLATEDVTSSIIGGASRIQELVNDLLTNCNYISPADQRDGGNVCGVAGLLESMGSIPSASDTH